MNKIRILVLNEPERKNGITWWRMYEPLRALEALYGDQVEIIWNRGVILPCDLMRSHVAIAWRPSNDAQLSVIRAVFAEGIPIIVDYDDDILNVPTGSPAYNGLLYDRENVKQILAMSAQVWVSTPRLAEVFGHNAAVIPNAIYPEMLPGKPNPVSKTVVWTGDYLHAEDVFANLIEYGRIVKNCNSFYWIGYMPTLVQPKNVIYTPFLSVDQYFSHLRNIAPNFIWKPIRKNVPFNLGKSNISKLVATMSGAVCATNFNDMPGFENCFREPVWKQEQIFGTWEAARDEIKEYYNLESWTHVRYKYIYDVANGGRPANPHQADFYKLADGKPLQSIT